MVGSRFKSQRRLASERGMAIAMVLLFLVLILLLGITLIGSSVTKTSRYFPYEGRSGDVA